MSALSSENSADEMSCMLLYTPSSPSIIMSHLSTQAVSCLPASTSSYIVLYSPLSCSLIKWVPLIFFFPLWLLKSLSSTLMSLLFGFLLLFFPSWEKARTFECVQLQRVHGLQETTMVFSMARERLQGLLINLLETTPPIRKLLDMEE